VARIAAIVSNGCNPDPRVLREARWLVDEGHEVTIHAFDRLQNLPLEETVGGIQIQRSRIGKTPYGGTISTVIGLRKFRNSVRKSLSGIDLLHCHDADTLALSNHVDVPVLFDMHDLHHTWALMPNPRSKIRQCVSKRMKRKMLKLAKRANAIITSSPGFVEWLDEHGLKATSIENRISKQGVLPLPDSPTIGYFGRIRETSSFTLLRDALLHIENPEDRPSILIAGDGTHADAVVKIFAQASEIQSEIRGPFTQSDIHSMMSEIGLMFAMYSPERGNITEGALPAKMFEAAAFGRPSIVNRNTPMGEICETEKLGTSVTWGDSMALSAAILELLGTTVDLSIDESRERARFLDLVNGLLDS
jgi:glycosyltransferase involved in cell wall biosynthesis